MSGLTAEKATPSKLGPSSPAGGIRELLYRRGLPAAQFNLLWAGRGSGGCCEACGRIIAVDQVEYELEYRQGQMTQTLLLHRDCWEESWQI